MAQSNSRRSPLRPIYSVRLVVYDSYSGVCDRINTRTNVTFQISTLALVSIRQNDNRIQLIVSCKWAFRNLSNHNFGNLLKFQNSCGCTCSFVVRILYFGITYILIINSCILLTVFHYSIHWKCTGKNFVVILPGAPGSDAPITQQPDTCQLTPLNG